MSNVKLEISLSLEEYKKLQDLAEHHSVNFRKKFTVQDVIRLFIVTAQPGGSGWTHPSVKKEENKNG